MEKSTDLESKYQKLATEYSKMRSHASVLKKAVLDEQSKILELKELAKLQEQTIRKHDQEMDSLTFRNGQLTKRIAVLQQELQTNTRGKKNKSKCNENPSQPNFGVLDEELHKKIIENAQLVSEMVDKDLEITNSKEKIQWLEEKLNKLQNEIVEIKTAHSKELNQQKHSLEDALEKTANGVITESKKSCDKCKKNEDLQKELTFWKQEVERWTTECNVLRSKPASNEKLTEYYESQIRTILETKQTSVAETNVLWAENEALNSRLEHITLEKNALERILDKSTEELHTTHQNYKSQLDAMTEHMAAQNEKITKQCDEIQMLHHRLSSKK